MESKSRESPKAHKKDKTLSSSGGGSGGEGRASKAAKRARRSPSQDYDGESKRSRKEPIATNGGGANEVAFSSSSSHKEGRKLEKEKIRERDRLAIAGVSSREASPSIMLSKERKEGKEGKEERKREHDRLLAIAGSAPGLEDRRKVEPLLSDGGHKKSKHEKHRSK